MEFLSNQWSRSSRKSSTSKLDTLKSFHSFVYSVLDYVARRINIFLLFANTRVMMEFFFPAFTAVLSSSTATQFSFYLRCFFPRMESILPKSPSYVPSLHVPWLRPEERFSLCYHQTNKSKQDSIFLCLIRHLTHQYQVSRSTSHLSDEFRSKHNINFYNNYKVIIRETFTVYIYFKRRNSANEKQNFWDWRKIRFFTSINLA